MSEQILCSQNHEQTNLVLEARRIVVWAGELTDDGEEVGGKGEQIYRAARLLRLPYGVIWRARHRRSGPEIFPSILEARNQLLERIAKQKHSPWHTKQPVRLPDVAVQQMRGRRKKAGAG